MIGGVCGVMIIITGNEHSDQVQILDKAVCISHSTNTAGKCIHSNYLGRLGSLTLIGQLV